VKTWADFDSYYLHEVQGCTYLTAANALRMAAQEFCERTKCWRATLDAVPMVTGTSVYDFDLDTEQTLVKLLSAKLDDQDIGLLLHDQDGGTMPGICALSPSEFLIQPTPVTGQEVVIKAVLMPSNSASGIEDDLFAQYARAIAMGAKAILFAMAYQPFTNPTAAMVARLEFETAIGNTTIRVAKAFSSAPLRVQACFM
jgi:hypothetical protein